MTKQIKIGKIKIGGGAPVAIQSMTKTDTRDVNATVGQIKGLEKAGCEIIRLAVKDMDAAEAIKKIRKKIKIPLVADIHFNYKLAIAAIENGADKIRLNPGNVCKEEEITAVAKAAKKRRIPIRVGVNSGSIRFKAQGSRLEGKDLAKAALDYIKILEKADFYDIIISLKASDVLTTIDAYRRFSEKSEYPLHLGVTAAGPLATGLVKSSIGIGVLLLEGIGDTIRVSLTGDPAEEVSAAKNILQALELRKFGHEIISCPTCGRCQVNLQGIVEDVGSRLKAQGSKAKYSLQPSAFSGKSLKIAIMGCEVNGPGEAKEADIGVACGKGCAAVFEKGKIIKRIKESQIADYLIRYLKNKGSK